MGGRIKRFLGTNTTGAPSFPFDSAPARSNRAGEIKAVSGPNRTGTAAIGFDLAAPCSGDRGQRWSPRAVLRWPAAPCACSVLHVV
eukprot:2954814-Rhodomonas_salina.1